MPVRIDEKGFEEERGHPVLVNPDRASALGTGYAATEAPPPVSAANAISVT